MPDTRGPSAIEIATAVRGGVRKPLEVTREFLNRVEVAQDGLNCFVEIDAAGALAAATRLEADTAEGRGGALCGVPFAAKDIFVHGGRTPTNGARSVTLTSVADGSPALERLDTAGAINLGWLNLDQFSYAATGTNPDFGNVLNPWDTARMTGGSSSGAAAAVAVGAVGFAIGADTGGSVRIPASFCGVVGLKPTFGRVPRRGAAPMCYSQDSLGILTRTVPEAAIVLEVMAGFDPLDASSFDVPVPPYLDSLAKGVGALEGLRLGIDDAYIAAIGSDEAEAAIWDGLQLMREQGAELVPIDLGCLAAYDVVAAVITWAEVGALHSHTFPSQRGAYAPATRARLDSALLAHGADHVNALRYQGRALREFSRDVLSVVDVVVNPTTAATPALIADVVRDDHTGVVNRSLDSLQLSRPFNLLGLPAMSVPMGFDSCGMPLGMHLVSRPWDEVTLLRCGAAYQELTDWHRRLPPTATPARPGDVPSDSDIT